MMGSPVQRRTLFVLKLIYQMMIVQVTRGTHTYTACTQACIHAYRGYHLVINFLPAKAPVSGDAAKPTEEGKPQRQPTESEVSDRLQVLHNLIQQYIHQVSTSMEHQDFHCLQLCTYAILVC